MLCKYIEDTKRIKKILSKLKDIIKSNEFKKEDILNEISSFLIICTKLNIKNFLLDYNEVYESKIIPNMTKPGKISDIVSTYFEDSLDIPLAIQKYVNILDKKTNTPEVYFYYLRAILFANKIPYVDNFLDINYVVPSMNNVYYNIQNKRKNLYINPIFNVENRLYLTDRRLLKIDTLPISLEFIEYIDLPDSVSDKINDYFSDSEFDVKDLKNIIYHEHFNNIKVCVLLLDIFSVLYSPDGKKIMIVTTTENKIYGHNNDENIKSIFMYSLHFANFYENIISQLS